MSNSNWSQLLANGHFNHHFCYQVWTSDGNPWPWKCEASGERVLLSSGSLSCRGQTPQVQIKLIELNWDLNLHLRIGVWNLSVTKSIAHCLGQHLWCLRDPLLRELRVTSTLTGYCWTCPYPSSPCFLSLRLSICRVEGTMHISVYLPVTESDFGIETDWPNQNLNVRDHRRVR